MHPRLKENLLGAAKEAGKIFGVNSIASKAEVFAEDIRKDNNKIATLPIGPHNLIWTKERGRRKLVFQTSQSYLEVKARFEEWTNMPWTRELRERGVTIELSSRTLNPREVIWGADEDMAPPKTP